MAFTDASLILNVTNGATTTTSSVPMRLMSHATLEVLTTGTLTGTVQPQISVSGRSWENYGSATTIAAATPKVIPWSDFPGMLIRFVWTQTGGAGAVTGYFGAKGITT